MYSRSRSRGRSRPGRVLSRKRSRSLTTRARPLATTSRRALADRAVELKHFDAVASVNGPVQISNDPGMTGMALINPSGPECLFAPSQGPGSQQRDGRLATVQSIYVAGTVYVPPAAATTNNQQSVFLALVLDRSPNQTDIDGFTNLIYENLARVPDPPNPDVFSRSYVAAPLRNLEWSKRFKVLKTKTLTFNTTPMFETAAGVHYGRAERCFTMSYRPSGSDAQVEFQGAEGTVENITKNAYYILAISNAIQNAASIAYNSRVRFVG